MSALEIIGFVFGVAGVWLTIKEHWACFPVGLVNVGVSLFLFLDQKLYSDTVQQGVYIILLSYGWYRWNTAGNKVVLKVGVLEPMMRAVLIAAFFVIALTMGYFFDTYTDADVPYLDAIATAMSFIAQFLIARKKIENWLLWMVVNVLYIGIYTYKGLYLYAILFLIYLVLAIKGYLTWKTSLIQHHKSAAGETAG